VSKVQKTWLFGSAAGLLAALVDAAMILGFDPSVRWWVVVEAVLFWAFAGWVVVASESGLGRFAHGVVVTMLLSLPWYLQDVAASRRFDHLPPLLIQGVIFGLGFGWVRSRVGRTSMPDEPSTPTPPRAPPPGGGVPTANLDDDGGAS